MAKRAKHLPLRYPPARVWFIAAALGVTLSACSDGGGIQTTLPGTGDASTSSPSPSALATSAAEVERLVTQRYLDFQRVVAASGAVSNADDPRLAEYATGVVLNGLRGKLAVRRQAGTRLYGRPVPHVKSVSVSGDKATVLDCLDNSATGLMDRSGKKLSIGRERQETTATLVQADNTWKVSEITTIAGGGSC